MRTYFRLLRFAAPYELRIAAPIACMAVPSRSTIAWFGQVFLMSMAGQRTQARAAAW